jgi:hypothetical protein
VLPVKRVREFIQGVGWVALWLFLLPFAWLRRPRRYDDI